MYMELMPLLSIPVLTVFLNILAYIDPGTGSIILQAIAAAVAGVAIAAKFYWHSVLKFLGIKKKPDPGSSVTQEDSEE